MANDLLAFNAEVFSKKLIMNLDKVNVMLPLVNREWEGELKNQGDTVHVRTLGSITMGAYTKDATTIAYEDLAPSTEAMVVADAQYFAFKVDDVDKAQNDMSVIDLYAQRAAVSMNDKIEAKLLSNYASAHTDNKINAAGSPIALDDTNIYSYIVAARKALNKKNVPSTGRWMVIDPDTEALLLQSDVIIGGATDMNYRTVQEGQINGVARPGFIGRVAGFDIYTSNNVPAAGGSKFLQFGDAQAIAYAAQINQIETLRLQVSFATAVRGLLLHDTKVFTENSKRLGYLEVAE